MHPSGRGGGRKAARVSLRTTRQYSLCKIIVQRANRNSRGKHPKFSLCILNLLIFRESPVHLGGGAVGVIPVKARIGLFCGVRGGGLNFQTRKGRDEKRNVGESHIGRDRPGWFVVRLRSYDPRIGEGASPYRCERRKGGRGDDGLQPRPLLYKTHEDYRRQLPGLCGFRRGRDCSGIVAETGGDTA